MPQRREVPFARIHDTIGQARPAVLNDVSDRMIGRNRLRAHVLYTSVTGPIVQRRSSSMCEEMQTEPGFRRLLSPR